MCAYIGLGLASTRASAALRAVLIACSDRSGRVGADDESCAEGCSGGRVGSRVEDEAETGTGTGADASENLPELLPACAAAGEDEG